MARPQRCVLVTAEASLQAPDAAAAAQVPVRRLGSRSAATARGSGRPSLRLRRSRRIGNCRAISSWCSSGAFNVTQIWAPMCTHTDDAVFNSRLRR